MAFLRGSLCLAAVVALAGCKEDLEDQLAALEAEQTEIQERIAGVEDEALRDGFNGVYRMMYWMRESRLRAQEPPEEVQYTSPELALVEDYGSPAEMAWVYLDTLAVERSWTGTVIPIEAFDPPAGSEMIWQSVTLEDGRQIPVKRQQDYDDTDPGLQAIFDGSWLRILYNLEGTTPEDASFAAQVQGVFQGDLPEEMLRAEFGPGDIGETRQVGAYEVTFEAQEDHQVFVRVARSDGAPPEIETSAIYIEARDETEQYLSRSTGSWGNPEQMETLTGILDGLLEAAQAGDLAEADLDALVDAELAERGMAAPVALYGVGGFRGIPQDVTVTLLPPEGGAQMYETVVLDVLDFDLLDESGTLPDIPLGGPVYQGGGFSALLDAAPVEIPADQIADGIEPRQSEYSANVAFDYPSTVSGMFLDAFDRYDHDDDVVETVFLDAAGEPITVGEEAFDWTVNRVEYEIAAFPVRPERVRGELLVNTMPQITRQRLAGDALPDWLSIDGNRLILESEDVPNGSSVWRYYARSGGRYLKPFKSLTYRDEGTGKLRLVEFHYGQIEEVELFRRGPIVQVPYAFDVELVIPEES